MQAKLKNYTTSVPAESSIATIQALLSEFGAKSIMLAIENKIVTGISFTFEINGQLYPFKLPVEIEKTRDYLYRDYLIGHSRRARKESKDFNDEAYRVAWRIQKDWIHSQLSIIATGNALPAQIFVSCLLMDIKTGKTLGKAIADGQMNLLSAHIEK